MGAGERCEVWVALKFLSSLGGRHSIDVSQSIVRTSASQTCEALILKVFLYESGSLEPRGQHLGPPPPDQLPLSLDNSLFYFLIILIPGALRELQEAQATRILDQKTPKAQGRIPISLRRERDSDKPNHQGSQRPGLFSVPFVLTVNIFTHTHTHTHTYTQRNSNKPSVSVEDILPLLILQEWQTAIAYFSRDPQLFSE